MGVKWINKTTAEGTATMFPNYLITNREFLDKFDNMIKDFCELSFENLMSRYNN